MEGKHKGKATKAGKLHPVTLYKSRVECFTVISLDTPVFNFIETMTSLY